LNGDFGVGSGGTEAVGLVGGHGPEFGCAGIGGRLGETLTHRDDCLASVEGVVSRVPKEVVVVGEASLHAGLFDGEEDDEAAFFGCGPYGLGWGEVAELCRSDGAGEAGRSWQDI
jgi:hypothetical protein